MRKGASGAKWLFLVIFAIIAGIAIGIDWLIEGHVSTWLLWILLANYVGLLLAGLHERLDDMRDSTQEVKEQNENLQKKMDELEKSLWNVERKVRYIER